MIVQLRYNWAVSDIYLYNSLTRKKEKLEALRQTQGKPEVGMYTCGPTVYNYQHIGNFRTMTLSDILRRTLIFNSYKVKFVRNITDIDDKTIKGAADAKMELAEFTKKYTQIFFEDLKELNILPADVDTKATDYIEEMIDYNKALVEKGLAYVENDGSVYFDISKFTNYGKLSRIKKRQLQTGTRILSDEYAKEDVQDFALWKSVKPDEFGYESPWGRGRPGWHIECSVMSQKNLGDTFDIHVGGIDLLFPHHENEIAQSEGKTGKEFVNYFVHGEFLLVDGAKMSKSLKNFYTVSDIEKQGFDPLALRYFYLTGHYRNILNFTWESLESAQNALTRLKAQMVELKNATRSQLSKEKLEKVKKYQNEFLVAVNDDLNTPQALAVLWEVLKSNIPSEDKYDLVLSFDEVLGLNLAKVSQVSQVMQVPQEVQKLVDEREKLRKAGKFEESDLVREHLEEMGYAVEDTVHGPKVKKL
ncbi:cysteine--tRNA ligase [Candidatus Woesebacteria bacterium RIFCSPHIGHO2_01_FULL_44_10]|uniref:Cysteine--tRNA ligase n=1 Tax=Candidatus Woesebacteria bacterium RIFCSPLOWO2_01_FULL_44_14 TaxID=1802525 RepID=A0A1F8C414_9BACT|nr:MAG: cysteine--tRNA ligase [Candidatus Woesebacteria bacterium RIFCSPHIGHO2_01_FULL_44_10]OGM55617.1 MAG: cysteine--tRNA ligase [Candidatus Woesebacteria bacterium RIFCSPHIGHO2_12_FULL_44_11]OGM70890.1 MAG: cysteine--tRNA ligase [Candidatus Woesebacteria bacterium RIFCSPLOWO2_01_FULL_44_14]